MTGGLCQHVTMEINLTGDSSFILQKYLKWCFCLQMNRFSEAQRWSCDVVMWQTHATPQQSVSAAAAAKFKQKKQTKKNTSLRGEYTGTNVCKWTVSGQCVTWLTVTQLRLTPRHSVVDNEPKYPLCRILHITIRAVSRLLRKQTWRSAPAQTSAVVFLSFKWDQMKATFARSWTIKHGVGRVVLSVVL